MSTLPTSLFRITGRVAFTFLVLLALLVGSCVKHEDPVPGPLITLDKGSGSFSQDSTFLATNAHFYVPILVQRGEKPLQELGMSVSLNGTLVLGSLTERLLPAHQDSVRRKWYIDLPEDTQPGKLMCYFTARDTGGTRATYVLSVQLK
jgi:hypothetical protein